MPLYDYTCPCGRKEERLAGPDETQACKCGQLMKREFSGNFKINMGVGPYGYYDEHLETYVHTNEHRRRVMKEKGVSERFGKGWI